MNIRNTTRFSKEAYYALNKTLSSKIYIACIVFEIVLGVLAAFIMIKDKDLLKGGIIILMMLAYPFVLFAIMNGQIRKNYEINKLTFQDMIYEYEFTDTNVNVHVTNKNTENHSSLTYQAIYKVTETANHLFIFISSNQAFIVSKDTFDNEECLKKVIDKIKKENIKYNYKKVNVKVK